MSVYTKRTRPAMRLMGLSLRRKCLIVVAQAVNLCYAQRRFTDGDDMRSKIEALLVFKIKNNIKHECQGVRGQGYHYSSTLSL